MSLAGAWILFPAVLGLLVLGWGLLVELATGGRIALALLLPSGFAALAVALQLCAITSATAPLSLPVAVGGAVAGLALCAAGAGDRPGLRALRPGAGGIVVALGAFALYAAPVVLSGATAVSGYIRLDDSATWMALADHVIDHGRSTAGMAPSTYEAAVSTYLGTHYPVGSLLPLAAGGRLSGQDLAAAYAPYLAFLAAMLALGLDALAAPLVRARWVRAAIAVTASGSALLYGYVMWGGVKEVAASALLALVAAHVARTRWDAPGRGIADAARPVVPVALACAAVIGALSVAGGVWLVPLMIPVVVIAVRSSARAAAVRRLLSLAVLTVAGSAYALSNIGFASAVASTPPQAGEQLGNLIEPLSPWQILGIWPSGDFRMRPEDVAPTVLLLVVLVTAAVLGLAWAVRQRAWTVVAYGLGIPLTAGVLAIFGWPWVNAKAMAVASPAPVLLAGLGIAALYGARRIALAAAGATAVLFGVVWSDALTYHDTTLTPHDRHQELADIGRRFAGDGPTLMTEFDPYGARWFLRRTDAEGAAELRRRPARLSDGSELSKGQSADIDAFPLATLGDYPTLVVRRSPTASRPPSSYRLAWRGTWYEVWRRARGDRPVLSHLGLTGDEGQASGRARCADVRQLAAQAGSRGLVRAATPRTVAQARLDAGGTIPSGWVALDSFGSYDPRADGVARTTVSVPRAGRYQVWLGGAFKGAVTIAVDGRRVGMRRHELQYAGQWVPFGEVVLPAGPHAIDVRADVGGLHPGSAGADVFGIGPVALVAGDVPRAVTDVRPQDAERLCGRELDWIEAVGPPAA